MIEAAAAENARKDDLAGRDAISTAGLTLEYGEEGRVSLPLKNLSPEVVEVKRVGSSCGCLNASVEPTRLVPGQRGSFDAVVTTESPGTHTYYAYIETASGDKAALPFSVAIVRSYVWKPETLVLEGSPDEVPTSGTISFYYYGVQRANPTVRSAISNREGIKVRTLKRQWDPAEVSSGLAEDKFSRPPFAQILVQPTRSSDTYTTPTLSDLRIDIGDPATDTCKSIHIPVRISARKIYRVYPNPIVKQISPDKDGLADFDIPITVAGLSARERIEGIEIAGKDGSLSISDPVEVSPGSFVVHLRGERFPTKDCPKKGTAPIRLSISGKTYEESVRYLLLEKPIGLSVHTRSAGR